MSRLEEHTTKKTETAAFLTERNKMFYPARVIKLQDNVYIGIGYAVSIVTMVVCDAGLIIIDTTMTTEAASRMFADFKKICGDKHVHTLIYTHSHGDHTLGSPAFVDPANPPDAVWGRSNFGKEGNVFKEAGLTIPAVRAARQAGFKLPASKRICNGIARAYWPGVGGKAFFSGPKIVQPTHFLEDDHKAITVMGEEIELFACNGETPDAMFIWFPKRRILISGDMVYRSFPNTYAIRGSTRNVMEWIKSLDKMLELPVETLIMGHTLPAQGEEARTILQDYRDALKYMFEETIRGINKGLMPVELVAAVRANMPEHLATADHLLDLYGNIEWSVRGVFSQLLGWFSGNPVDLFPFQPAEEAARMARLAGGEDKLLESCKAALAEYDGQWAAQLADHLIALGHAEARLLKADALDMLAAEQLTTLARNYMQTVAEELRK